MAALARTDTILRGRVSDQEWTAYGPTATADQDDATWINTTPTDVVSTTLDNVAWGKVDTVSLLNGTLADEINTRTRPPGTNSAVQGSPTLVNALLQHDRLDERQLIVHNVVVYKGQRLFDTGSLKRLDLLSSKRTRGSVVILTDRPRRAPAPRMFTLAQINDRHDRFGRAKTLAAYLRGVRAIGVVCVDASLADGQANGQV